MTRHRYEDFVRSHIDIATENGAEVTTRCVVHDDSKPSMGINLETGLWHCFSCGAGGGFKALAIALGVRAIDPEIDVSDIVRQLDEIERPKPTGPKVYDETFLKRFSFPTPYWRGRGYSETMINLFDLGMDPIGDDIGGVFASIPMRDAHGQLLGVIRRYLDDDAPMKYRYPKGLVKSDHLFGSWLVGAEDFERRDVVLVEGSLDAIKVWQAGYPALAILGSDFSAHQMRMIERLDIRSAVLFFDNDEAGRKATSSAQGFRKRVHKRRDGSRDEKWEYDATTDLRDSVRLSRVVYPRRVPADPGAMSIKQIRHVLDTSTLTL